jgi:glucose 1-dehydrogenase
MRERLLNEQIALITGASSGIGKATAIRMAAEGAKVVVNYHSDETEANEVVEKIKNNGGDAIAVKADVGKEEEVEAMFDETIRRFGAIDILVNNAGIQQDAAFIDMTTEQWKRVFDTNLTGHFYCARRAAKEFLKQGVSKKKSVACGKIIFTSSVHDIIPWAGHANYAATKGGMLMFMKTLAQELAPKKIRVNAISPGAIKTDINDEHWKDPKEAKEMLNLIPYKRIGEPEDVARLAAWLASDEADYIVGATIYIDGGMTLYPAFSDNG